MLLRASNAVGYTNYPDNVVRAFIKRSAADGIDVFRIFDSLNSTENMQRRRSRPCATTRTRSAKPPSATPATSSIPPAPNTAWSTTCAWPKNWSTMGTHVLGIKDMAGPVQAVRGAFALVKALREEVGVPIHFHTHDTSGINAASVLRAADAGVDIVDAAVASMSGMTSQPILNSLVAALRHTERDTGLDLPALDESSRYWEAVRELYYPFEEGLKAPESDVYHHEMPGGQYTNLQAAGQEPRARATAGRKSATPTPPPTSSSATSSR